MESSKIRFFLTGSRFFGWERPDSDWDFFTESTVGVATTLRLLGFREDLTEGYQDGLTRQIFVGHSIHVQLVNSVVRKHELNLFFGRNRRLLAVPKYGPNMELIWTPRSKEEQKAAWQTAVTMCLSPIMRF
jgi:hypothetical protein